MMLNQDITVSLSGHFCFHFSPFGLYLMVEKRQWLKKQTFRNESLLYESTVTFTAEGRT